MNYVYHRYVYAAQNFERVHYGGRLFLLEIFYRAVVFDALISLEQIERRRIVSEIQRHKVVRIDFLAVRLGLFRRFFFIAFRRRSDGFGSAGKRGFGLFVALFRSGRLSLYAAERRNVDYFVVGRRTVRLVHNLGFYLFFYVGTEIFVYVARISVRDRLGFSDRLFVIFGNINVVFR